MVVNNTGFSQSELFFKGHCERHSRHEMFTWYILLRMSAFKIPEPLQNETLPFSWLKGNWKVTEKHISVILSPFQTIQLSFNWLNGRTSSCAWSIFGLLDNQVAEMKLSPIIGKIYTIHIPYLEKWVPLHFCLPLIKCSNNSSENCLVSWN